MSIQDIYSLANEIQACFLSTVDGDEPRVRGFLMWYADETGFYFHTGGTKDVCRQLKKNPNIEVCFYKNHEDMMQSKMLRVRGKVEFLEDRDKKVRLMEERPFLKEVTKGDPADPMLQLFRITDGEAHVWTMMDNLNEAEIPRYRF